MPSSEIVPGSGTGVIVAELNEGLAFPPDAFPTPSAGSKSPARILREPRGSESTWNVTVPIRWLSVSARQLPKAPQIEPALMA